MNSTAAEVQRRPRVGRHQVVGRVPAWLILGLLGALLIAQQARDLADFSARYTEEDQTLLWDAGRLLLHGHLHGPSFWGQNYNTVFEAVPGEILHLIGVSLAISDPAGAAAIVTVSWLTVAWAALRRGALISAVLALGLPLLLSIDYLLLADQLRGVLSGDLLGALAVAASVGLRRPGVRLGLVIALAGVAVQWDNAAVLAAAPAVVAALSTDWRELRAAPARSAIVIALGLIPPAAWFAYTHLWFAAHPGALTQPGVASHLQASVLWGNLKQPAPLFGYYTLELVGHPRAVEVILAGLIALALAAAIRYRRLTPGAVAVSFLLVLLVVLSVQDTASNFEPNLYLSGSRFLLPMPFGAWLVAHHLLTSPAPGQDPAGTGRAARGRTRPAPVLVGVVAVVLVVSLISAVVSQTRFNANRRQLLAYEAYPYGVAIAIDNPGDLLSSCRQLTADYRSTGAQMLLTNDRPLAYGCAAQSGINTLFPGYDRRFWEVEQATTRPLTRILLTDGFNCTTIRPVPGRCRVLQDSNDLLITPPRPLAQTLAALKIDLYDGPAHPNIARSATRPDKAM